MTRILVVELTEEERQRHSRVVSQLEAEPEKLHDLVTAHKRLVGSSAIARSAEGDVSSPEPERGVQRRDDGLLLVGD